MGSWEFVNQWLRLSLGKRRGWGDRVCQTTTPFWESLCFTSPLSKKALITLDLRVIRSLIMLSMSNSAAFVSGYFIVQSDRFPVQRYN